MEAARLLEELDRQAAMEGYSLVELRAQFDAFVGAVRDLVAPELWERVLAAAQNRVAPATVALSESSVEVRPVGAGKEEEEPHDH
jgi:hypothetical protein